MPSTDSARADLHWMNLALREARRGVGLTSPNPPVGAVVVKDGVLLGSGYHRRAGGPHAEVEALRAAMEQHPKLVAGATLYVTLEPCSTVGRTPACTGAILRHGLARVVYGAGDPNPRHAGAADSVLKAEGLRVTVGVMREECEELIRPFRKWITRGVPYVIAKAGQSLDGRLTRPAGESQWITNEAARAHGRRLRRRVDAILVGAETIRRDNPLLTLRDADGEGGKLQPWRVVLTRSGDLPPEAQVLVDAFKERTLVLKGDLAVEEVLQELARREITSVLVEGGGVILGQFFRAGAVDEAHWYLAPRFCGGGRLALEGEAWSRSMEMSGVRILPLGDNVLVWGYPDAPGEGGGP
jgi:diaminohydroxyphosphoribosylaminopyrimidine deaminase/5-amino-6-(5-phosphoribosylamino)uracil reductase